MSLTRDDLMRYGLVAELADLIVNEESSDDVGSSGVAGTLSIYPATANKGKLTITCTDQTGDTTVALVAGAMAAARTITIPDPGAAASVLLTTGTATSTSATTAEISTLAGVTAGTVTASKACVVDASSNLSVIATLGVTNLDAGASGTAGSVDIFPTTASKGKLAITCTDQTGNTTVSLVAGAMAAARTITIPDPGAAASVLLTTGTATATSATTAEISTLAGVTAGTVTASKACVVDASSNLSIIATLGVTNLDAGASGTAGSVDIFPATASRGKLAITCTDQTGDTTVSLVAGAMAAARTITIPDPGAAASVLLTTGTATATSATTAEIDTLAGVTAGTITASKACVVDASSNLSVIATLGVTNLDAGASGTAGSVDVFPATASRGKLAITCTDQTGDTTVSLVAGAMAAARTITIPDPGAAASVLMTTGTATATSATTAEIDTLAGVTAGTVTASKACVVDASSNLSVIATLGVTNLDAGASGTAGTVDVFPSTANKGKLAVSCTDQTGDTTVSLVIGAMADARTITLRDPGAAASILTTTDATAAATSATAVEISRLCDTSANLVLVGGTTLAVTEALHDGKTIGLDHSAATSTCTLPDATGSGARFRFVVVNVNTNNHVITVPDSNNVMTGSVNLLDNDSNAQTAYAASSTDDTLTLNGTTTGGQAGDWVEFIDIKADTWAVRGQLVCPAGSNVADPFSAAV